MDEYKYRTTPSLLKTLLAQLQDHTRHYILDANGNAVPIDDTDAWLKWYNALGDKGSHLGDDLIKGVHISTVFLGVDHGHDATSPPILWETMIFGGEHDQYQDRYTSREDALAGHQAALALVKGSKVRITEKPPA